jgi:multidrug efflux pump
MSERIFDAMLRFYDRSLGWALRHPRLIPKGFFWQQDTGRINGNIQADQSISFQLMRQKLEQFVDIIGKDPAVDTVVGFTGTGQTNGGNMFLSLKPIGERKITADQVIRRLSGELAQVPGATLFLQAVQDIRVGGRAANAQYQFTLQADSVDELYSWAPRILAELQKVLALTQVNSDQQNKGLETDITIDRDTPRGSGSRSPRIPSMTHLVSAKSQRSPLPATSITSSWNRPRNIGRTRRRSATSMSARPAARSAARRGPTRWPARSPDGPHRPRR